MQNPLAACFGVSLICIGTGAIFAPRWSAGQYGLPTDNPTALGFVRATGARDIALGGALLANLANRKALAGICTGATIVALTDAAVVGSIHGWRPQHLIHLSGAIAMALAGYAYGRPPIGDS